jgi:hypothetical protein
MPLNLKLEFRWDSHSKHAVLYTGSLCVISGGAELLVGNVREHNLSLADQDEPCKNTRMTKKTRV